MTAQIVITGLQAFLAKNGPQPLWQVHGYLQAAHGIDCPVAANRVVLIELKYRRVETFGCPILWVRQFGEARPWPAEVGRAEEAPIFPPAKLVDPQLFGRSALALNALDNAAGATL